MTLMLWSPQGSRVAPRRPDELSKGCASAVHGLMKIVQFATRVGWSTCTARKTTLLVQSLKDASRGHESGFCFMLLLVPLCPSHLEYYCSIAANYSIGVHAR